MSSTRHCRRRLERVWRLLRELTSNNHRTRTEQYKRSPRPAVPGIITLLEDRTMDTDTRQDEALYTRQIDDVVFQLDGAGGLAFVDLRDGDEARLVELDKRQHRALMRFYAEIFRVAMRDALRARDRQIADICLTLFDTPAE